MPQNAQRHHFPFFRGLAVASASAALTVAFPAIASAHVHATPSSAPIGGYTDLAFGVGHGCDGSPTTKIEFTVPEELEKVTPNVNANWDITKESTGSGENEKVQKVIYTAKTPLPSDLKDSLTLSVKVTNDAKPSTVEVPTLQTCEKGSMNWAEKDHDSDYPAPTVELIEKSEDDEHSHGHDHSHSHDHGNNHGTSETEHSDNHSDDIEHSAATTSEDSSSTLGSWGLGFGLVGALTGIAALVISLRKRG